MEKALKTVIYTLLVFACIFIVAKALFFLLPVIIVAFIGIYLYGKFKGIKSNKSRKNEYTSYNKQDSYTSNDDDGEVIDVDYKDVN